LRLQTLRANALFARARAALSYAATGGGPGLLKAALADARRLEREGAEYCRAVACQIRATVAHQRGQAPEALRLLAEAERMCDRLDMHMAGAALRWRHGQIVGGSEGEALLARARQFFADEQAVDPAGMVEFAAPGFQALTSGGGS